jgi:hypothetical protein
MAAVILRCGDGMPEGDGRRQRSVLLRELVGLMPVRSYGLCVNNARWPQGAERDKMVLPSLLLTPGRARGLFFRRSVCCEAGGDASGALLPRIRKL